MQEENKGFNWVAFLLAPYYYAGYGKAAKGLVLAVLSFIPITQILVGIYAGLKADKELPIGRAEFQWGPAVGVFACHLLIVMAVLTQTPAFKKEVTQTTLADVSGIWRGESAGELVTIDLAGNNKRMQIESTSFPATLRSVDTDNHIITLNVKTADGDGVWTIRQVFKDGSDSFSLLFTAHNGMQEQLGFVRRLDH